MKSDNIKSCFTCIYRCSEGGYKEGYYGYSCDKRDLPNDKRFPYKFTKCKYFKRREGFMELYEGETNYIEEELKQGKYPRMII